MLEDKHAVECQKLLARTYAMLEASKDLIDQTRTDDARDQLTKACATLREAVELLKLFLR